MTRGHDEIARSALDPVREAGDRLARLRKAVPLVRRAEDGLAHGVLAGTAAVLAYLPTQILGLREGFWAAITALAVVQPSSAPCAPRRATSSSARRSAA